MREIIDHNCERKGWLVFATHDIADSPTAFGGTPRYEQVVGYAAKFGTQLLPVVLALRLLRAT